MNRPSFNANAPRVLDQDGFVAPASGHGVPAGRMLSLPEVAECLDVSLSTVRRRVVEGRLRVHRIGRAVRVSMPDLEAFLSASRGERA